MFNKYVYVDSKGQERAAMRITSQMKLDRESRENIAQKEIKARDRVDISLEEYERMKNEISSLRSEIAQMRNKLELFNEVIELDIIPDTLVVLYDHDICNMKYNGIVRFEFIPEHRKRY